ncbi:helix-turn-helix transcriptional regulator [Streptomyces flavofungini]|uniref:helix-turn-helix transcriptional regulator n=1 Tax=Streptomyces flavofungini TaxID=68200 RepID=UPI0025B01B42|nr:LuxR family transcriptional regulator [Streptomyces flavofungini]WJV47452.1 AAA family ATPase [Streptomyces flavofungini]
MNRAEDASHASHASRVSQDPSASQSLHASQYPHASHEPHTDHDATGPALVGRAGEVGELLLMLEGVQARRPGVVLIEGAPGTGRTALLERLARHGRARDMTVLRAQCGAMEQAFAFGVIRQLFKAVDHAGFTGQPPSTEWLFGLFEGLLQEMTHLAERAPVLMVVDDFHHADLQSAQWIDFLARRLHNAPVLIVLATDRDVPAAHRELTAELALSPLCHAIDLGPLPPAAVGELTVAALGEPADDDFVRLCLHLSGGNPKLLTLLLREFTRGGIAPLSAERARAAEAASRVTEVIVPKWLARYPDDLTVVAGMTALLGDEADVGLLQQLTGLSHRSVSSALTLLERTGLLRADGSHRSFHPVVRAALSSHLSLAERADIQARAAHLLFTQGVPHERVADLILTSEPTQERWQVGVLRAAATDATARGATDRAITYLRRAAQATPFLPERASLLLELGALESRTDVMSSVRHLEEGTQLTADPALRARGIPLLADGLIQCGQAHRAMELLDEQAAETAPDDAEALRRIRGQRAIAAIAAGIADEAAPAADLVGSGPFTGRPDAVPDAVSDGVPVVGVPVGTTPGERALLAAHALYTSLRMGSAAEAMTAAEGALHHFDAEREPLWCAVVAIEALRHADRLESASRWNETISAFDLGGRPPAMRAVLRAQESQIRFQQGDLPGALTAADEALRLLPEPHPYGALVASAAMLPLVESGRAQDARRIADDPRWRAVPENWLWPHFLAARAQLRAAEGHPHAALHDLEQCGRLLARYEGDNPGRIAWRSQAAQLHRQEGRPQEAQRLSDEELVLARRWGAPITLAKSLRAAALADARSDCPELLEESVLLLEDAGCGLELVRSLIAQGTALHAAGRTESAREVLRRALGLAQAGSAQRAAQEAYHKLLATGARPRRYSQVGPRALTAGQRRVVELAVQGLSNEDIAGRLYVTQRTVEFHLTNAYRKLGITGRTDLARTLRSAMAA